MADRNSRRRAGRAMAGRVRQYGRKMAACAVPEQCRKNTVQTPPINRPAVGSAPRLPRVRFGSCSGPSRSHPEETQRLPRRTAGKRAKKRRRKGGVDQVKMCLKIPVDLFKPFDGLLPELPLSIFLPYLAQQPLFLVAVQRTLTDPHVFLYIGSIAPYLLCAGRGVPLATQRTHFAV